MNVKNPSVPGYGSEGFCIWVLLMCLAFEAHYSVFADKKQEENQDRGEATYNCTVKTSKADHHPDNGDRDNK